MTISIVWRRVDLIAAGYAKPGGRGMERILLSDRYKSLKMTSKKVLTLPIGYDILAVWDEESACSAFDRPPGLRAWGSFLLYDSDSVPIQDSVSQCKGAARGREVDRGCRQGIDWSSQIRSMSQMWVVGVSVGDLGSVCGSADH